MKPKTIFFDWHNTLCTTYFWSHIPEEKNISKFLFIDNPKIVKDWMLGKYTSEEICTLISRETRIEKDYLLTELENSFKGTKFADKDTPQYILKLKEKGIRCVIATDNMDCFSRFAVPYMKLNEIFDDILNSYYLGCFKYTYKNGFPFFDNYLKQNNLGYEDVVLIDDSIDKNGNFERLGFHIHNFDNINSVSNILKEYFV